MHKHEKSSPQFVEVWPGKAFHDPLPYKDKGEKKKQKQLPLTG